MIVERKNTFKQNKIFENKNYKSRKNYKFERAENFKYFGVKHNGDNHRTDLQDRLKNANKSYFRLQNFFQKIKTYPNQN
jgi:hypothetical protein